MPHSQPTPQEMDEAARAIFGTMLPMCVPLYWHDRTLPFPKVVEGASCFILGFGSRYIGVTAAHVIDAFEVASAQCNSLVCQMRSTAFPLSGLLLGKDAELDIATFEVPTDILDAIGRTFFDCSENWPPPEIHAGRPLWLAGFPEHMRIINPNRTGIFQALGAISTIEDVSERELILTFDPERDRPVPGMPMPPLGLNMSGCSGGPMVHFRMTNGLLRYHPVALISSGSRRDPAVPVERGEAEDFDMVRGRRIHFIEPDGSINRPAAAGWLPGRP